MEEEALAPVLRVTDADTAIAWYQRLGFVVDTEWSSGSAFAETTAVIRRGELALILSNREKGARADALIYLRVADLADLEKQFNLSATSFFGGRQLELHDPDGNRIRVVSVDIKPRRGRLIGPN
jgi:catechol 2,3-dioxygenase-like lactoylglutathione lyase family enzyme